MAQQMAVLGLGNLLCEDDGIGIHVLRALEQAASTRFAVDWIDGGVLGMGLLPLVESCSHLLVLDAIDSGAPAGTLIELHADEVRLYGAQKLSEHQVTFNEVLAVAGLRRTLPQSLVILGIQPMSMSLGIGLTAVVSQTVPRVVERALLVLDEWGCDRVPSG
jgi:hydrogenase maturation protease